MEIRSERAVATKYWGKRGRILQPGKAPAGKRALVRVLLPWDLPNPAEGCGEGACPLAPPG